LWGFGDGRGRKEAPWGCWKKKIQALGSENKKGERWGGFLGSEGIPEGKKVSKKLNRTKGFNESLMTWESKKKTKKWFGVQEKRGSFKKKKKEGTERLKPQ